MRITTSSAFPPPTPNLARHPASLATWIFQKPRLFRAEDMVVAFVQDGVANVQDRFARSIEEPLRDEALSNQRSDDLGNPLNGQNDLELISGALGTPGACLVTRCRCVAAQFTMFAPEKYISSLHLCGQTGD